MASKLLSHTLQSRTVLTKQFVRPLATSAVRASTRTTTLSNGLTVATEGNPASGAATVGVWVGAGSRSDTINGTANFLEHIGIQGHASSFEKLGAIVNGDTCREQTFFAAKTLGANVSESVEILADLIQNPKLDAASIEAARKSVLAQQAQAEKNLEQVTFDHLHAMAFQGESLGRPIAGVRETVESLTTGDLSSFHKANYGANRLVLVGSGDVSHEALVKLAEKSFGQLAASTSAAPTKKALFTGSEIRLRDDVLPQAHVAMAVEAAPYLSADYFNFLVMQALIGTWSSSLGGSSHLSSRLSTIVNGNHLADYFTSFTEGFKDTGLFGLYFASQNREQIDDFVHFAQSEWVRLSTSVTSSEVERAKQQVKASLLLKTDSTCTSARDIGSQILGSGKHLSGEELKQAINKITAADIRRTANQYLWDQEVVVAGVGPIEGLTDYNRVRGNMAYNRF